MCSYPSDEEVMVAVDVEGTSIVAGIVTKNAQVYGRRTIYTEAKRGAEHVLANMLDMLLIVLQDAREKGMDVKGIGVSTAGQIDPDSGIVSYATDTFPGWSGFPIKRRLQERIGIPVYTENDAYAAGWGEKYFGLARNVKDFIMLTLGTGIGGAIFVQGRLLSGSHNLAGLIGHMSIEPDGIPCNCGGRGCVERYASGTGIVEMAARLVPKFQNTSSCFTAQEVFSVAEAGDNDARRLVDEVAKYLGTAIGALITVLNPEMVVLSGGVSHAGKMLLDPTIEQARWHSSPAAFAQSRIVLSEFLGDCGLIGAAAVGFSKGIPRVCSRVAAEEGDISVRGRSTCLHPESNQDDERCRK